MNEESRNGKVTDVFTNVHAHRSTADLIRRHSTNPQDIREVALSGSPLADRGNILDLGCGFGFFTEALAGKVPAGASVTGIDIVGGYEPLYLQACQKAGLKGRFFSQGVSLIREFPDDHYDLILCSYALYFFPEIIPEIARVLSGEGLFITITHDRKNMGELIKATKSILTANGMFKEDRLPVEEIISRFSAENGLDRLSPWFARVETVDYENALFFQPDEVGSLVDYFRFKSPFFLSGTDFETEAVARLLSRHLEESVHSGRGFILSKNDRIFRCSLPRQGGNGGGNKP